jgi:hypothetical protein
MPEFSDGPSRIRKELQQNACYARCPLILTLRAELGWQHREAHREQPQGDIMEPDAPIKEIANMAKDLSLRVDMAWHALHCIHRDDHRPDSRANNPECEELARSAMGTLEKYNLQSDVLSCLNPREQAALRAFLGSTAVSEKEPASDTPTDTV